MRISVAGMLRWVVPAGLAAGGLGAWPTWAAGGREALLAEIAAGLTVLALIVAATLVVMRLARRGPAQATLAMLVAGLVVAAAALGLAAAARVTLKLPIVPLFLWVGIFYFVMLVAQSLWLSRGMMRRAALPGQGG